MLHNDKFQAVLFSIGKPPWKVSAVYICAPCRKRQYPLWPTDLMLGGLHGVHSLPG